MASSGSFNTTAYDGRYLTLSWSVQSQSTENNTSTISWTLKGAGTGGSSWYRAGNFKVVINGVTVYSSSTRIQLYNGTVVSSGTLTIPHNNDGTKTFTASAEAGIYTVAVNCRGSGTFTLPTISRYATATGATNFTDVQNPSVSFTNPAGSKLQFKIEAGGNVNLITRNNISNPVSPYVFQLTEAERNSLRALCPNSNTLSVTFTVGTYNSSGSVVNWSTVTRTMTITAANPTISGAAYKDTNAATVAITGNNQKIIQNTSTLQLSFTSLAALKYATLSKIAVTINGVTKQQTLSGSSASNVSLTFGVVNVSSDINAQISLTDSRNNVTSQTLAIDMEAWSTPSAIITCQRINNYEDETQLNVNADYASLNGNNAVTIQYQYKQADGSTWSALTTIQDDVTTTFSIDNTKEWNVRVIVSDLLGSTTYNLTVERGVPIVFFDRLKRSVGINCFPQNDNSIESNGLQLDDLIYIGSQVLYDSYTMTASGTVAVLGSYNYDLIQGLFSGVTIPDDYVRAYRVTAQINTRNSNNGFIKLNNIQSNNINTWSSNTMRKIASTRIFKETDITLETTFGYTRQGTNLYCGNDAAYEANFYNITVHGYLVKDSTTLPAAASVYGDTDPNEPAT